MRSGFVCGTIALVAFAVCAWMTPMTFGQDQAQTAPEAPAAAPTTAPAGDAAAQPATQPAPDAAAATPTDQSTDQTTADAAATDATTQPTSRPVPAWTGPMQVRDLPAATFLYSEVEVTYAQLGEVAPKVYPDMLKAAADAKVAIQGPAVEVYRGASQDPDKPFKVQLGYIVAADTKPFGPYLVRPLEASHCATTLYTGPMEGIGLAYQSIMPAMLGAGLNPENESRHYILFWENADSGNNILMVTVSIKQP